MFPARRAFPRLTACFLLLATSFWASCAEAQASLELQLEWNAPAGCPPTSEVLDGIRQSLNGRLEQRTASLEARADVTRTETGEWELVLEVTQPEPARRRLNGEDCAAVARAAALLLAMMLAPRDDGAPSTQPPPSEPANEAPDPVDGASDPSKELPAPEDEDAGPVDEPRRAEATQPPASVEPRMRKAPDTAPSAGLAWDLELALALDVGTLPAPRPGLGLGAELSWRSYRLRAWLGGFLPASKAIEPAASARFMLAEGQLQACLMPSLGSLALQAGPCIGAAAGMLWAQPSGLATSQAAVEPLIAPLATLAVEWRPERSAWGMRAAAGILWARNRPRFLVGDTEQIHQPSPIGARAQLGLSWYP